MEPVPPVALVEITDWGGKLDMDARSNDFDPRTSTQVQGRVHKVEAEWDSHVVFVEFADWGGRLDVAHGQQPFPTP